MVSDDINAKEYESYMEVVKCVMVAYQNEYIKLLKDEFIVVRLIRREITQKNNMLLSIRNKYLPMYH